MTTEELFQLGREVGWPVDEHGRFVVSREQLVLLATAVRTRTFQELHPFAVGPGEHEAIDRLHPAPVDSLAERPVAVRLSDQELMEGIGMAEWSPRTLLLARRVEHLVLTNNRLRLPEVP